SFSRKPGLFGRVRIPVSRKPVVNTPVREVPPGTECPPPVQNCNSCPPSSTRDCVQASGVPISRMIDNNIFMKLPHLGSWIDRAVKLATIQQTFGPDKS